MHKAWITLVTVSREDARGTLPLDYRTQATIIRLNKFSMDEIDEILKQHDKQ